MNKKVTDRKPRTKKIEPFSGMAEDSIKMTPKEDINNLRIEELKKRIHESS